MDWGSFKGHRLKAPNCACGRRNYSRPSRVCSTRNAGEAPTTVFSLETVVDFNREHARAARKASEAYFGLEFSCPEHVESELVGIVPDLKRPDEALLAARAIAEEVDKGERPMRAPELRVNWYHGGGLMQSVCAKWDIPVQLEPQTCSVAPVGLSEIFHKTRQSLGKYERAELLKAHSLVCRAINEATTNQIIILGSGWHTTDILEVLQAVGVDRADEHPDSPVRTIGLNAMGEPNCLANALKDGDQVLAGSVPVVMGSIDSLKRVAGDIRLFWTKPCLASWALPADRRTRLQRQFAQSMGRGRNLRQEDVLELLGLRQKPGFL